MNITSTLDPVIQTVNASPHLPAANKEELAKLLTQLQTELQQVPSQHATQAQAIAEATRTLVETANHEEPDAHSLHAAVAALEEAAEAFVEIAPQARESALDIVSLTQGGSA